MLFRSTNPQKVEEALRRIKAEMEERVAYFKSQEKHIEAQRIKERTTYDMDMIQEIGSCSGIENYSRHMSLRNEGETPSVLIDFFKNDFLLVIDESHVTIPQVRGMYNGDRSRKQTLVEYGFRLPSALDNRPLNFSEFEEKIDQVVYVSATPGDYEKDRSYEVVEQIIRPTGLLDPLIEVKPTANQIDDVISQLKEQIKKGEKTLITTLTIKMSEDLTNYLKEVGIKVAYLHSEIKALERMAIIRKLRQGVYDCIVGINLLREGLDIPEVSLVLILDADKEGFLRSERSLIQTIGRAARNANGRVIMYADKVTDSMSKAIVETYRRRSIQEEYNSLHNIVPTTIQKEITEDFIITKEIDAKATIEKVHSLGKKVGIVVNPEIPVENVFDLIPLVDMVLLMSVHPGFGGQSFITDVLDKIVTTKKFIDDNNLDIDLEIDGGINPETAKLSIERGVNVLVAGNTVFKAPDKAEMIKTLRQA